MLSAGEQPPSLAIGAEGLRNRRKDPKRKDSSAPDVNDYSSEKLPRQSRKPFAFALFKDSTSRLAAWEESRTDADGTTVIVAAGHNRALNTRNIMLALRLAPWTIWELAVLFWRVAGIKLLIFLLGRVWAGIGEMS